MIDCHVHTKRSHHGEGDLEDFVVAAMDRKLEVIGFAEHAPLGFDPEHRLTEEEVEQYLSDLERLKEKYHTHIKILSGLEADYFPGCEGHVRDVLEKFRPDFVVGSVHFLKHKKGIVDLWNYEEWASSEIRSQYFRQLNDAVNSDLFDAVAHPDALLRAGVPANEIEDDLMSVVDVCQRNGLSYELNCSGISKNSYDPPTGRMVEGKRTYPLLNMIRHLRSRVVPVVIGSDAHKPSDVGRNIDYVLSALCREGVHKVSYFENRERKTLRID